MHRSPGLGARPLRSWHIDPDALDSKLRNLLDGLGVGFCYMLTRRGAALEAYRRGLNNSPSSYLRMAEYRAIQAAEAERTGGDSADLRDSEKFYRKFSANTQCALDRLAASESPSAIGTAASYAGEYAPIKGCLTARNGEGQFSKISRISNNCGYALEAIWIDTNGGKNQVTINANSNYQGGDPVKTLWACRKNDGARIVNGNSATCYH